MSIYNIMDFGAVSNGDVMTVNIQNAIDEAYRNNGGKVIVPSGEFLTGSLRLRDNIELHLLSGAILKFSDDQSNYPVVKSRYEGHYQEVYASCIYAEDVKNISITGFGKLNGKDRKSTRLNSSHVAISYAVFCLKKK